MTLRLPSTLPWLGGALELQVDGLPSGAAFVATGFGDQSHGGLAQPLDLGAHGMPGCLLRVGPECTVLVFEAGATRAPFALPVPNQPALVGQVFFQQALVPDPAANPAGAVFGESMRGVVGSR